MESRIPLKPVLGSVRIVALFVSANELTQYNREIQCFSTIVGSPYI